MASKASFVNLYSRAALFGAVFIALTTLHARAAELVMFTSPHCSWCVTFEVEIGAIYEKTTEGLRAPLRRVEIDKGLPPDLSYLQVERMTPLFVLVDKGKEIGRIRGYPGEDHFWGLLGVLIKKLDMAGTAGERAQTNEKTYAQQSDSVF